VVEERQLQGGVIWWYVASWCVEVDYRGEKEKGNGGDFKKAIFCERFLRE